MKKRADNLLRLGAAAKVAGVSRPTLAAAIDRGDLAGTRHGVQRVVKRSDLDRFLVRRGRPARSVRHSALVAEVVSTIPDGYALGGNAAVSLDHPNYHVRSTQSTVWVTAHRLAEVIHRLRSSDGARVHEDPSGHEVGLTLLTNAEIVRVLPWPSAFGRLVARRDDPLRRLTPDRLLVSIAIEQALRVGTGSTADTETIALLLLETGISLANVADSISAAERTSDVVALPSGIGIEARPVSARALASTVRRLIASVLRRIAEVEPAEVARWPWRTSRSLGRSVWLRLIEGVPPEPIAAGRLGALCASL